MPMVVEKTAPKDDFHISLAEFDTNGRHLGSGSFSQVSLIKRYYDQKNYALKVVDKKSATKKRAIGYVVTERRVMLMLNHPHIIRLFWTTRDDINVYFIYEYAPKGELWTFLQKQPKRGVPLEILQAWSLQILSVLYYLHMDIHLAHRDLKPENILLDDNFNLLVADFGTSKLAKDIINEPSRRATNIKLATKRFEQQEKGKEAAKSPVSVEASETHEERTYVDNPEYQDTNDDIKAKAEAVRFQQTDDGDGEADYSNEPDTLSDAEHRRRSIAFQASRTNTFTGTAQYMPPELIDGALQSDSSSGDLWAYGVTLYQLATGTLPYTGPTDYLVFQKVLQGDRSFLDNISTSCSLMPEQDDINENKNNHNNTKENGNDNDDSNSSNNNNNSNNNDSDSDKTNTITMAHLRDLIDSLMSVEPTNRPKCHISLLLHPFFQSLIQDKLKDEITSVLEANGANPTDQAEESLKTRQKSVWEQVHEIARGLIASNRHYLDQVHAKKYVPVFEEDQKEQTEKDLDETF